MKIDILTLFPEMFDGFLNTSIIKRARDNGNVTINVHNFRDYSTDKHNRVDDYPYGGGAGMVLMCEPIFRAIEDIKTDKSIVIMMSPSGKVFKQEVEKDLKKQEHIIILCGHYEGIDQRAIDIIQPEEVSIGDYVLTGGEIPAMVLIDSISRYVPGVIKDESTAEESFSSSLLEYPQYTRPEIFMNIRVPEVLLSGHHKNINKWRREQSLINTYNKRPELLNEANLTEEDKKFIEELSNKK